MSTTIGVRSSAINSGTGTHTVSSVIDQLSIGRGHINILIAAALGTAFDSFNTNVVSFAMPSIMKEWTVDPIMNGLLNSAGIWGMFVGALVWGPLTDRFGRKLGFAGTIFGFAALSGFTALAHNVVQFGILRFITGMCLGGMIPVCTTYVSECVATRYRGRFLASMIILWPGGQLAAAGVALVLVPHYGWRSLFIVGILPAFLTFWMLYKLTESPRWLAAKGRMEESKQVLRVLGADEESLAGLAGEDLTSKVPISVLLKGQYLRRLILTCGYYFFAYFGYYGFVLWLPTILATVYHLSLVKTFSYTFYAALAAIGGRVAGFYGIEKFGRKPLFYIGFGLGGVAALIFGGIKNPAMLLWGACALAFIYEQGVTGTVVWTAELYPSKVRATAVALSTSAGRVSSALSPVVFGWFLKNHMYYNIYITIAVMFWITVALVFFLGEETKGKTLQEMGAA
jgi:putative MFS transporter